MRKCLYLVRNMTVVIHSFKCFWAFYFAFRDFPFWIFLEVRYFCYFTFYNIKKIPYIWYLTVIYFIWLKHTIYLHWNTLLDYTYHIFTIMQGRCSIMYLLNMNIVLSIWNSKLAFAIALCFVSLFDFCNI